MRRSQNYPHHNKMMVYTGVTIVAGVAFFPSLLISIPLLVSFHKDHQRHKMAQTAALIQYRADVATRAHEDRLIAFAKASR